MTQRAPVDAVLFDMDGTLLNSWDALVGSYQEATRHVLGAPFPVERADIDHLIQLRARDAFPELAGGDLVLAARIEAAFGESYRSRADDIALYDGVEGVLRELHAGGVRLGIATSKSRVRLDRDLAQTGIADLMSATVCGDEVPIAKPDPAPILAVMERLRLDRAMTLYVGDGANDVMAARSAGVRAVGAGYGFHPQACRAAAPDLWIDRPADLLDVVAAIRAPT
jgi:HAD superfamily hydrolase (TIGR01549 family)